MAYLYCLSTDGYYAAGLIKLGYTMNPIDRLATYKTGYPTGHEPRYYALWEVNATSEDELRRLEGLLHDRFHDVRQPGKEWFSLAFDDVQAFMTSQPWFIRQLSIHETKVMKEKPRTDTSAKDFFEVFLGENKPRPHQLALWETCKDSIKSGVVQWPTGSGKTLATIMLVYLKYLKCKSSYRGLVLAPQNNILDTVASHYRLLKRFGIHVIETHHGRLSKVPIPGDVPILVLATHQSLTSEAGWDMLPAMTHIHYDEVHNIGGQHFYAQLKQKLEAWQPLLTGTSATPLTCNPDQNKKVADLFGNPLNLLSKCDIGYAVEQGWIAKPRFSVGIMSGNQVEAAVEMLESSIERKRVAGNWKGGKVIIYFPTQAEVRDAVRLAKERLSGYVIYAAVDSCDADDDVEFVKAPADGTPRVLFACEKYREGSDIHGLEMTVVRMGQSMAANVIIQIAGRALRADYAGKEGWCVILKEDDGTMTTDEVLDQIVQETMVFLGKDGSSQDQVRSVMRQYFGDIRINGKLYDINETIDRIQSLYERKAFERATPKERYERVRRRNQALGLRNRQEYEDSAGQAGYIGTPKEYFAKEWVSWYHFIGRDTLMYPATKAEWNALVRRLGHHVSWDVYKAAAVNDCRLPPEPEQMYADYRTWEREFNVEEEHIY